MANPATDAQAWRYAINYGPDGEENYANVYDGSGALVSNLKIHHAVAVVETMNRRTPPHSEGAADRERIALLVACVKEFCDLRAVWTDPHNDLLLRRARALTKQGEANERLRTDTA